MQEAKFIISKKKVLEQYNLLTNVSDKVSYSSKTNPDITNILEENTKSMFTVHFENELKRINDFSRVIFMAQAWNDEKIKELVFRGINNFIVDNEKDLNSLLAFIKKADITVNVFLRVKLKENTIRTEKYFVFGMPSEVVSKRIIELETNKNIGELGIHFHRKTQNMSEWDIKKEIEDMFSVDVLKKLDWVNIGGGLPSEYANTNVDVLSEVFKKISAFKSHLNNFGTKLMIEPGRFIAAPSVKLVTYILGIQDGNITINASVYNSDMDALIVPVKLLVEGEVESGEGKPYVIKGITPCSMDLFRYKVYLKNPLVGGRLTFLNAGAYNFHSDFCDLDRIKTEVVEDF